MGWQDEGFSKNDIEAEHQKELLGQRPGEGHWGSPRYVDQQVQRSGYKRPRCIPGAGGLLGCEEDGVQGVRTRLRKNDI